MFGFLRGKSKSPTAPAIPAAPTIPPQRPDNPGSGWQLVLREENAEAPDLSFDLVELLRRALEEEGVVAHRHEGCLELDNGMMLQPLFLEMQGTEGRIRSATTIQTNHPTLCPEGIFEFQHANGETPEDALLNGFRSWVRMDFMTLSAALKDETRCTTMRFVLPDGRTRHIVLGPFTHYMAEPPAAGTPAAEEAEKFCPCCLFSSAHEALMPYVEAQGTVCLRLFAYRSGDVANADCRANGLDAPDGAEALKRYAAEWLPKGEMEFRKQYVVVYDIADAAADAHDTALFDRSSHHHSKDSV